MTTTAVSLPRKMRANRKVVETPCTSCAGSFQLGEEVYACATCDGFHHLACWTATGRCTRAAADAPIAATTNAAIVPPLPTAAAAPPPSQAIGSANADTRTCPICAETIKAAALKCRHCGHVLDAKLAAAEDIPPPGLDWRLAAVLAIVTLGLFLPILAIWQAGWAKKVENASRARIYYVIYAVGIVMYGVLSNDAAAAAGASLFRLIAVIFFQCGNFSLRQSIESHYHDSELGRVDLSGLATFFLGPVYFQYHFTQVRARRKALMQAA